MCTCHPTRPANYDVVVPIHYVKDKDVLFVNGTWDLAALVNVIGRPEKYPTHTVRLFLVVPGMSVPDIKIDNLERMLGPYARHHDLSVKITYYPNRNLRTSKSVINYDQDGSQGRKRLSIDIFGKEAIEGFRYSRMQIMRTILNDMHLHFNAGQPVEDPFAVEDYVDEWLTFLKLTDLDPGSEYDYNFLRVHRVKDGECSYVDFRIDIPTARESV